MTKSKIIVVALLAVTLGGCDIFSTSVASKFPGAFQCFSIPGLSLTFCADDVPAASSDAAPFNIWVAEGNSSVAMSEIQFDPTSTGSPTIKPVPIFPGIHAGGIKARLTDPDKGIYELDLWHDNTIETLDPRGTLSISMKVPVSGSIVNFTVADDGKTGIACVKGDPNLYVFDMLGEKYLASIPTVPGASLRGWAYSSSMSGYATDAANGSLYFYNGASVASIPLSSQPTEFGIPALLPDNSQVWVPGVTANNILVVDTGTDKLTATLSFPNLFDPREIAFSPDGKTAYILFSPPACFGAGALAIVDTESRKLTKTIALGNAPSGLALSPGGTYQFVANSGSGNVAVIDSSYNVNTYAVGQMPVGVATTH